jgi:hypothetical protein
MLGRLQKSLIFLHEGNTMRKIMGNKPHVSSAIIIDWIDYRFLRAATALPIFIKFNISNKSHNRS